MKRACLALLAFFSFTALAAARDGDLRFAELGSFRLESGQVIQQCRIGYRTLGALDKSKSNAILFPTWFTGASADLVSLVGPDKMIDSTKYYVVLVDALGNGVSSSPSNSRLQPRLAFPKFTIRDMVNSQYRLLTGILHLSRLRAVVGISMGGMQTFQWAVSYPGFMEKVVPIVGTPRLTSYDMLLWTAELDAIQHDRDYRDGNYTTPPALSAMRLIHLLALTTPQYRTVHSARAEFPELVASTIKSPTLDPNDYVRQLQAMLAHDAVAPFGGSIAKYAIAIKAKPLVIVATHDHMVNPEPAREVGQILHAQIIELGGNCGHLAVGCEAGTVQTALTWFLL